MKEIVNFLLWQWDKWQFSQKCYIVGAFFFGFGLGLPDPYQRYFMIIPVMTFVAICLKWFLWDQITENYKNYKKEKQELFEVIKDSHK